MSDQFKSLEKYLSYYIKVRKPMVLKDQIEIYNKRGYIEHGKELTELPTFEQWQKSTVIDEHKTD